MEWCKLELEEKKMLCETIKKILYGIEFDDLPSTKVLRCIENNTRVVLEFKYHFRYLVPQVYGWEYMGDWMEIQRKLSHNQDGEKKYWQNKEIAEHLQPNVKGISYFELSDRLRSFEVNSEPEHLKHAVSVCDALFSMLGDLVFDIEQEDEYLKKQEQREAVLEEIDWQCCKMYELSNKKAYGSTDLHDLTKDFVNSFIENRLMKCTDTLSGEDSGLNNFWDELCVQVQQEHSFFWNIYLQTLDKWLYEELKKLPNWKLNGIWVDGLKDKICDITDDEYEFLDGIDTEKINIEKELYYFFDGVAGCIRDEIMGEAANYSNDAIVNYIEGSYEHD